MGDVFDFYFGRAAFFHRKYRTLIKALEDLASTSVRVLFIQGNHEFSLERSPWKNVEIVCFGTKIVTLKDGTSMAFSHGDYLLPKKEYFFYMAIVRSQVFQRLAGICPGWLMNKICLYLSSCSRKKYKPLDKKFLKKCARTWLESTGASFGFSGHYHISLEDSWGEGSASKKMIFIPSWHRPNALGFKSNQFISYQISRKK